MKRVRTLTLRRDTLRLLEDDDLRQPMGGINPLKKTDPIPPTHQVCTATCIC